MYISAEQRKFLIIVVSVIILLILDITFILSPLINMTFDLSSQVSSVKKNIANLNQQISKVDDTKKKLALLKDDYLIYGNKFPKAEEIPRLLETLSTIAAKSEINIVAIRPQSKASKKHKGKIAILFQEMPIQIIAQGGYHQIGSFINRLETLDRFLKVDDISLVQSGATGKMLRVTLLVSTYISKGEG